MKNRFARGSLNSCSSELVCIEKKGTSEILKHSEVFTRISSELVTAVPIRGGTGVSRRVENNYRGKSCTKVYSVALLGNSSRMLISLYQWFPGL